MEAVGAAATIVGLVQAGLGLAKALNTYAGTVHDANDDIAVIADDIYATYRHLNDLDLVLKQNEKAGILTPDALQSAQRCIKQAGILIQKLKKLLVKGHGSDDAGEIVDRDQIDIGKFKKGIWYIYKSEFELRRNELAQIKADISLIYLTYLALSAGTTTERKQAEEEMELVYNRKAALNRNVKKAREKRDRDVEEGPVEGVVDDEADGIYDYSPELEDTAIIYDNVEALYREFENWLAQKERKAALKAGERKKLEEDAIAKHQEEIKEKAQKAKTEAQTLRQALLRHGIPTQRALEIASDIFPGSSKGESDISTVPLQLEKGVGVDKSDVRTLLDPLRDFNEPGGIAQLKAFYLQRVYASPTRSEIMKLEVAVSGQHLLQKTQALHGKAGSTPSMDGFGGIPEDYVLQIHQELATLQNDLAETWILLHVEPIRTKAGKRKFRLRRNQKTVEDIVGVQIVIRKVSPQNSYGRADEVKAVEAITYRARQAAPELESASMPAGGTTLETSNAEYYPRHASQLIARSRSTVPSNTEDFTRRRGRVYHSSSDSSPERDRSERRARFAPEVIAIPSPRYDDSVNDAGQNVWVSGGSRTWDDRSRSSRARRRVSESPVSRWGGEHSPAGTFGRTNSGISMPSAPRRRMSTSSNEQEYPPVSIRMNKAPIRTTTTRPDRIRTREYRTEADTRRVRVYRNRPQSIVTSYELPHRSAQRRSPSDLRLLRPSVNRRVSLDLSDEEEEIIPQSSTRLPPGAAVQDILNRWGCSTEPARQTYKSDIDVLVSGPFSRRSPLDGTGKSSYLSNGTRPSFEHRATGDIGVSGEKHDS